MGGLLRLLVVFYFQASSSTVVITVAPHARKNKSGTAMADLLQQLSKGGGRVDVTISYVRSVAKLTTQDPGNSEVTLIELLVSDPDWSSSIRIQLGESHLYSEWQSHAT